MKLCFSIGRKTINQGRFYTLKAYGATCLRQFGRGDEQPI